MNAMDFGYCAVKLCPSTYGGPMVCFPRDPDRKKRWKQLCGLRETDATNKRICRNHFSSKDFYNRQGGRMELRPNVEPNRNLPTEDQLKWLTRYAQVEIEKRKALHQLDEVQKELKFTKILLRDKTDECDKFKDAFTNRNPGYLFYCQYAMLTPFVRLLIDNEMYNSGRHKNGRRFSDEIKLFCQYLYVTSPDCYRILELIFNWPSRENLLSQIEKASPSLKDLLVDKEDEKNAKNKTDRIEQTKTKKIAKVRKNNNDQNSKDNNDHNSKDNKNDEANQDDQENGPQDDLEMECQAID